MGEKSDMSGVDQGILDMLRPILGGEMPEVKFVKAEDVADIVSKLIFADLVANFQPMQERLMRLTDMLIDEFERWQNSDNGDEVQKSVAEVTLKLSKDGYSGWEISYCKNVIIDFSEKVKIDAASKEKDKVCESILDMERLRSLAKSE